MTTLLLYKNLLGDRWHNATERKTMKLSDLLAHMGDCKLHIAIRDDRKNPKFNGIIHHVFNCGPDADRSMKNCRAFVNEVKVNSDINGDPIVYIIAELIDAEDELKGDIK